jgi:hypothetical protein
VALKEGCNVLKSLQTLSTEICSNNKANPTLIYILSSIISSLNVPVFYLRGKLILKYSQPSPSVHTKWSFSIHNLVLQYTQIGPFVYTKLVLLYTLNYASIHSSLSYTQNWSFRIHKLVLQHIRPGPSVYKNWSICIHKLVLLYTPNFASIHTNLSFYKKIGTSIHKTAPSIYTKWSFSTHNLVLLFTQTDPSAPGNCT